MFASLYVVAKAAVNLLFFLPFSSSFSSCFLFFFSTHSDFGASFNIPLFLNPLNAFPSQLLGVCLTQRPSHLPPVSLEHQNHLFPFHILVHVSCPGLGFSLLTSHLGRCGFTVCPSFFVCGCLLFCCMGFGARFSSRCSFSTLGRELESLHHGERALPIGSGSSCSYICLQLAS